MSNNIMRSPRRASRIGEHTACPQRQSNGRPVHRGTDSPWRTCGSLRPRDDELLWEVRDGGTPSPAPETGALPSNVNKFCSAINHSFVTEQNVQAKNAVHVAASRAGVSWIAQRNQVAPKIHAAGIDTLRKANEQKLAINLRASDVA